MQAVCWYGKGDIRVESVPDPQILNSRDAIIRVTSAAICGSDLHLYNGVIPTMEKGDVLGHEFMGEVVELGRGVKNLRAGDRVVVPFNIACGQCFFCKRDLWSLCDNSNPNGRQARRLYGYSSSGLFGYSHLFGGYAGGQAEFVRVPFADVGPVLVESDLTDEQVLFLSDVFPTGYMAAENCNIQAGDIVAVWGCGPVAVDAVYDRVKQAAFMATDRLHVLRQAIQACRKGGVVSIPGVYGGLLDKVPFGAAFSKGLTLRMGQTHVHKYLRPLLARITKGEIDPAFVITHRLKLNDAPAGYRMFNRKDDGCIKILLKPDTRAQSVPLME